MEKGKSRAREGLGVRQVVKFKPGGQGGLTKQASCEHKFEGREEVSHVLIREEHSSQWEQLEQRPSTCKELQGSWFGWNRVGKGEGVGS